MNNLSPTVRAALRHVKRGWRVLPVHSVANGCCTCGNPDCSSPGKHPRTPNGLKDATIDPGQVQHWWEKWPDANIAIATGSTAGVCVLDVDPRNGGEGTLNDLLRKHTFPPTPVAKTGGGGFHYYFALSEKATGSRNSILPGIDYKADGGYVITPPSQHESGAQYRWLKDKTPAHLSPAPVPLWLENVVRNGHSSGSKSPTSTADVIPEGCRHDTLVRVAGALRRQDVAPNEIAVALAAINENRCDPPLPESEVVGIAESTETWKPAATTSPHYYQSQDGIYWNKTTRDGVAVPVRLTNFSASIVADIEENDGLDSRRNYELEAKLHGQTRRFVVPAAQFPTMNWVVEHLGAKAIVSAGMGLKDHARVAIQELSPEPERRQVFTHTGWREHQGNWVFLHAEGAIGEPGLLPEIRVQLPGPLSPFRLPAPVTGGPQIKAIRGSLKLLDLAPPSVTFPLFNAVWASVMGRCDYAVFLAGQTGVGKTEVAALHQQHFGSGFTSRNLPATWSSTANANEALTFTAKDAVLVVDDFLATGTIGDIAKSHKEADRLIRSQGNSAGRLRMRADATIRSSKTPRGLIFATGEDVPRGQSLRARIYVVEIAPDALNWDLLTDCQADAADGLYASTMAGYLQWMAPQYESRKRKLPQSLALWRARANNSAQHRRVAETVAHLQVGFCRFLQFAKSAGAITKDEALKLKKQSWRALGEAAAIQNRHQKSEDPVRRFFQLTQSAISTGKAHLGDAASGNTRSGQGDCIGWTAGDLVYLDPDRSFAIAQRLAQEQGESITVGQRTLWKRMQDRGFLAISDQDRNLVKTKVGDQRIRALALKPKTLGLTPTNRD